MVTKIKWIAIALIVGGAGELFQGLFGINPLIFAFGCPSAWGIASCGDSFSLGPDAGAATVGFLGIILGAVILVVQLIKYKGKFPKEQDYF